MKIILASQSPRRKQLLEQADIKFKVQVVETDEQIDHSLALERIPIEIAKMKANAVSAKVSDFDYLIAADTIVCIDNEIIGKPQNREHAIEILHKLSGKTHRVITGVVILKKLAETTTEIAFSDTTEVTFNALSTKEIEYYVDHYQPYDKAGAYAIQEWIGVVGIQKINGCFYNVMGLPISKVLPHLEPTAMGR